MATKMEKPKAKKLPVVKKTEKLPEIKITEKDFHAGGAAVFRDRGAFRYICRLLVSAPFVNQCFRVGQQGHDVSHCL